MSRISPLTTLALLLALAISPASSSQIWDFAADFSIANGNPNGAWTYGYRVASTGVFATSPNPGQTANFIVWVADETGSLGGVLLQNYTSQPVVSGGAYIAPGQATLHPGQVNPCAVRWTSPGDMWIKIEGAFAELAGGDCDTHVLLNGASLCDGVINGYLLAPPSYTQSSGTPEFPFLQTIHLTQGDNVDFVLGVGPDSAWTSGTTGLEAVITDLNDTLGSVSGYVRLSAPPNHPIAGAIVRIMGTSLSAVTGDDGHYDFQLLPGAYTLRATVDGCAPQSQTVDLPTGGSVACDFSLDTVTPAVVTRIGEIRALPEGTPVTIALPKAVTVSSTVFTDGCYYIEEPDRACGIRISPASGSVVVAEGDRVTLVGTLAVNNDGERMLEDAVVQTNEPGQNVRPLGMTNSSVRASIGVDRTGVLVRIWGWVTYKSPGGDYVYIDDGSRCKNGTSNPLGVMVVLDGLVNPIARPPEAGEYITVSGLAGYASTSAGPVRVVRPRGTSDISGVESQGDEASSRSQWFQANLGPNASTVPFSFIYNGQPSSSILQSWTHTCGTVEIDSLRTQVTHTYTDPQGKVQLRCVGVEYHDFPTLEWTVYIKNTGSTDTQILENIQAVDTQLTRTAASEFVLHHAVGSPCQPNDYQPLQDTMTPSSSKTITAAGGRSTNSDMSYFNIEWQGQGVIMAVGWPGQWSARFTRDSDRNMRLVAGQELTRLRLHPGEEIRTPLIALQFWTGTRVHSQNVWRRWMVKHNMPHPGGHEMVPQYGGCWGNIQPNAAEEIAEINGVIADGVQMDHWIIDAGWYPCNGSWPNVGTWEPDWTRFPNGLREVADHLHARNIDFIVWFEPERVAAGSWLALNHPEWIFGGSGGGLLNMGNPDAWAWITNRVDSLLTSEGIDHLRNDYNIDPLGYWRGNDPSDRQGITENFYVQGFLAFWDELMRRHPNMYIDTCASGGRRNDLETTRRAIPLLRSDYAVLDFTPSGATGQQCQTYAISDWLPYHGTGAPCTDIYTLRSSYCPISRIGHNSWDPNRNVPLFRQAVSETQQLFPYWLSDFYPLTPYSLSTGAWMAWQLNCPELGEGSVQVFRRENSSVISMQFSLGGLEPASDYLVTNQDTQATQKISGQSLMSGGLQVTLPARGSALFIYKRTD